MNFRNQIVQAPPPPGPALLQLPARGPHRGLVDGHGEGEQEERVPGGRTGESQGQAARSRLPKVGGLWKEIYCVPRKFFFFTVLSSQKSLKRILILEN